MNRWLGALITILSLISSGYVYPDAMMVTEVKDDVVTVETATGNIFTFHGAEDYEVGDMVATIMYSNGTDNVTDDSILCVRYAG